MPACFPQNISCREKGLVLEEALQARHGQTRPTPNALISLCLSVFRVVGLSLPLSLPLPYVSLYLSVSPAPVVFSTRSPLSHGLRDGDGEVQRHHGEQPARPPDVEKHHDQVIHDSGGVLGEVEGRRQQGAVEPQEDRPEQVVLKYLGLPQAGEVPCVRVLAPRRAAAAAARGGGLLSRIWCGMINPWWLSPQKLLGFGNNS